MDRMQGPQGKTTTTRALGAAIAALLLTASACTASKVDPDAPVAIAGEVSRQDATAVPGVRVALHKEPDLGEVFSTVVSLGLSCLTIDLPKACKGARITTTGGDGAFRYDLEGRDTQGTARTAARLTLSAHLPRSDRQIDGPAISTGFIVQTDLVEVPLRFWEPRVRATGNARDLRVTWDDVPEQVPHREVSLGRLRERVRFEEAGGSVVWEYANAHSGAALDTRLIEDTRGAVSVVSAADGVSVTEGAGSDLDLMLRSARYPYASPGAKPLSRGRGCWWADAKGRGIEQTPCALTDGDFSQSFRPCDDDAPCTTAQRYAMIDLGRRVSVGMVAARGCLGACTVETSLNRTSWKRFGSGNTGSGLVAVSPSKPAVARYVRVSAETSVDGLTEVSVWGPTRAKAGKSASIITALSAASRSSVDPAVGAKPGLARRSLPWAAAALILALVAGLFFRLGRRRAA